jgi:hypothetical protein
MVGMTYPNQPGSSAPGSYHLPSKKASTLGIIGLVLGILGLLVGWVPFIGLVALLLLLPALLLGVIGFFTSGGQTNVGRGLPIAATLVALLALLVSVGSTVATGVFVATTASEEVRKEALANGDRLLAEVDAVESSETATDAQKQAVQDAATRVRELNEQAPEELAVWTQYLPAIVQLEQALREAGVQVDGVDIEVPENGEFEDFPAEFNFDSTGE